MFWHRSPFLLDNICGALSVLHNLGWLATCLARLTDPACWSDWSECGADCFACLILLVSSNFVDFRCDSIKFSFGWFLIIQQSTYLDASLSCGFTCLTTSVARDLRYRILVGLAWLGLLLAWLAWSAGLLACSQKASKNQPFQTCQNDRSISRKSKKQLARSNINKSRENRKIERNSNAFQKENHQTNRKNR